MKRKSAGQCNSHATAPKESETLLVRLRICLLASKISTQCLWHKKIVLCLPYCWLRASLVAQTVKNLPAMPETQVQFLGGEEPPGEGNGHTLQYSRLENSMDRGAQWATVHGVAKSQTQPRTNTTADCTFSRRKKTQISRNTQSSKSSRKKWTRCLFLLGLN